MTDLASLAHTEVALPHGGKIVILETGAAIGPESEAMLQALHSRSVGGIASHLEILAEKGSEKFMSTYYVGYGHKSIGDCGSATVFIEGLSMLAAKAIQDWPLYSGQESSTRYLDFSKQTFLNPQGTPELESLLKDLRALYLSGLREMQVALQERFPRKPEEKESTYSKAIAARAFDTLRCLLPAGAVTNIAWHGNLRQFADKVQLLRHHPLEEVQQIAIALEEALLTKFKSSFSAERFPLTEVYQRECMQGNYYFNASRWPTFELSRNAVDRTLLRDYRYALTSRPPKTELPKQLAECGTLTFNFLLDFGSFRDLQRHRAVVQRMPLLTTQHGFHPWYLSELPAELRARTTTFLERLVRELQASNLSPEQAQYYIPMGFQTTNRLTGALPALVYLIELRSTRFVHPTLRERAKQMAATLQEQFGAEGLLLHLDQDADRFDVRRGEHDIVRKDVANG